MKDGRKLVDKLVDLFYGLFKGDVNLMDGCCPFVLEDQNSLKWTLKQDWRESFPSVSQLEAFSTAKLPPIALKMIFTSTNAQSAVSSSSANTTNTPATTTQSDVTATAVAAAMVAMYALSGLQGGGGGGGECHSNNIRNWPPSGSGAPTGLASSYNSATGSGGSSSSARQVTAKRARDDDSRSCSSSEKRIACAAPSSWNVEQSSNFVCADDDSWMFGMKRTSENN